SNGQLQELWWTSGPIGQGPLIPTDVAPPAASDPAAYFVAATGTSHVVYRGTDNHVHELFWTRGVVSHNDLTELADATTAGGVPVAYFSASDQTPRLYYRCPDG